MNTPKGWVKYYVLIPATYERQPHPRLRMLGHDQCWFLVEEETGDNQELYKRAMSYLTSAIGDEWMHSISQIVKEGEPGAGKAAGNVYSLEEVLWRDKPNWG